MELWADQPRLQFYTGNFLKGGAVYAKHGGLQVLAQKIAAGL